MTEGYCVCISEGEDFARGTEVRRRRDRITFLDT